MYDQSVIPCRLKSPIVLHGGGHGQVKPNVLLALFQAEFYLDLGVYSVELAAVDYLVI